MKKLMIVSLLSLAVTACGSKPAPATPANKTTDAKKTDGAMGGAGYGGGSAKPPVGQPGDPCAM
ncbi:hypothetical protein BH11MYX1_BH11MYX1_25660 [soil metagenome]